MSTDVLILGGGIGGLATAHDLRQRGFKGSIRIIERNNKVGGQARSDVVPGTDLPTEYCWRIYGPNYTTLRRILKQIPYEKQTASDNLIEIPNVIVPRNNGKYFEFHTRPWSMISKYLPQATDLNPCIQRKLMEKWLYLMTSSRERLRSELGETTWEAYFGELTPHTRDYMVRMIGPVFGVDIYQCSVLSILDTARPLEGSFNGDLSVMNGPTSERFLEPWRVYLESLNVEILVNATVKEIVLKDKHTVDHILVEQANGNLSTLRSNIYVFDLPIEVMAALTQASYARLNEVVPVSLAHWPSLAEHTREQMVGIQLYFDQVIRYPDPKKTMILMVETPWQLIILPTVAWNGIDMKQRDPQHKIIDSWTIGLCDPKSVGWKIQKPWTDCTREEIAEEVWYQIVQTKGMVDYLPDLKDIKPIMTYLWYSYQPDAQGIMQTWEPKFSPNAGTWEQRPDIFLPWKNSYLATAYVKGSREMILMDAAAEAGARVAEQITTQKNHLPRPAPLTVRALPLLFGPLWYLDRTRVHKKKSHLAKSYFHGSSVIMMFVYVLIVLIVLILIGAAIWHWMIRPGVRLWSVEKRARDE